MTDRDRESAPILVPVDFSPFSRTALIWGARAAASFDAPLEVLHVVHDPGSDPGYYQKARTEDDELQRFEVAARKMMDTFVDEVIESHPELESLSGARRTLVPGIPVGRILEVAKSRKARLIVMGSQGRTGLPKLLLGSKAERVVQLSPIPVTIVKLGSPEDWEAGR